MLRLDKTKKYLLACSFGPDSMALFGMLLEENYTFSVAHVNYHKRDVSDFEEKSLRELCEKKNIPFFCLDTKGKKVEGNFQDWARQVRYAFFQQVVKEQKLDALLVAHQQDDVLETYCMQKKRQTRVHCYGIQEEGVMLSIPLLRPLLSFSKQALQQYCDYYQIPYSIDVSNLSDDYERNRIRHHIVAKWDDVKRQEVLQEIRKKNENLRKMVEKVQNCMENGKIYLPIFFRLNLEEKIICLTEFCNQNFPYFPLTRRRMNEWMKAMCGNHPNLVLYETEEKMLVRAYDWLEVRKKSYNKDEYSIQVDSLTSVDTPYFHADLQKMKEEGKISEEDLPILIRNCEAKDSIRIGKCSKKVARLFIDWKLPLEYRRIWPIVLSQSGKALFIPRYKDKNPEIEKTGFYMKIK